MGSVIAICGKGGVGKTTLAALLSRLLAGADDGKRTLVIDGDPAGGLAMALGLTPRRTLDELRREMIEEIQDAAELAAEADYRLLEMLEERGSLAFLSVGRPEEEGCYCKLNTFLRGAIEALAARFDLTIVDAEAGVEQVNRRVMRSVERLLLVSDTSRKGLRVAEAIRTVASIETAALVVNRVRPDAGAVVTEIELLASLPEDPAVGRFDAAARPFFELPADAPALQAVREQVLPWLSHKV